MRISMVNQRGNRFARRAAKPGTKQPINDQIDLLWPAYVGSMNDTARVKPGVPCRLGFFW